VSDVRIIGRVDVLEADQHRKRDHDGRQYVVEGPDALEDVHVRFLSIRCLIDPFAPHSQPGLVVGVLNEDEDFPARHPQGRFVRRPGVDTMSG